MCVCVCVYTERERDRERKSVFERKRDIIDINRLLTWHCIGFYMKTTRNITVQ